MPNQLRAEAAQMQGAGIPAMARIGRGGMQIGKFGPKAKVPSWVPFIGGQRAGQMSGGQYSVISDGVKQLMKQRGKGGALGTAANLGMTGAMVAPMFMGGRGAKAGARAGAGSVIGRVNEAVTPGLRFSPGV